MKIKCLLDDNGYVTSYAYVGNINNAIEANLPDDLSAHFEAHFTAYIYSNGALSFDNIRNENIQQEIEKNQLRIRRANECFTIINRGKLWYDLLTPEHVSELNIWYKSWLDITDTKVVPNRPEWLV